MGNSTVPNNMNKNQSRSGSPRETEMTPLPTATEFAQETINILWSIPQSDSYNKKVSRNS